MSRPLVLPAGPFIGLALILAALPLFAAVYVDGPVPAKTGGFGETTCRECHWDNPLNEPPGRLTVTGIPQLYTPGERYVITLGVVHPDVVLAGFQLSARFDAKRALGTSAGTLRTTDAQTQLVFNDAGIQYIQHTRAGTKTQAKGLVQWTFEWTAPLQGGSITFHVAGNASNGDDSPLGDLIYTTTLSSRSEDRPIR